MPFTDGMSSPRKRGPSCRTSVRRMTLIAQPEPNKSIALADARAPGPRFRGDDTLWGRAMRACLSACALKVKVADRFQSWKKRFHVHTIRSRFGAHKEARM